MGFRELQLVGKSTDAALYEGDLASGVDARPRLFGTARAWIRSIESVEKNCTIVYISARIISRKRTFFIVDRDVDQRRLDAFFRGGGIVEKGDGMNFSVIGTLDRQLPRLLKGMGERLNEGIYVVREPANDTVQDKLHRRLVAG